MSTPTNSKDVDTLSDIPSSPTPQTHGRPNKFPYRRDGSLHKRLRATQRPDTPHLTMLLQPGAIAAGDHHHPHPNQVKEDYIQFYPNDDDPPIFLNPNSFLWGKGAVSPGLRQQSPAFVAHATEWPGAHARPTSHYCHRHCPGASFVSPRQGSWTNAGVGERGFD